MGAVMTRQAEKAAPACVNCSVAGYNYNNDCVRCWAMAALRMEDRMADDGVSRSSVLKARETIICERIPQDFRAGVRERLERSDQARSRAHGQR
jgi:hypothetical protein